jgi:hypothetical protein
MKTTHLSNPPDSARKLSMLLVGALPPSAANTISDHIFAFTKFSRHHVLFLQNVRAVFGDLGGRAPTFPKSIELARFDVLVIHYTCYLPGDSHFDAKAREAVRAYRGLKVLLIQDEYRQINLIHERIRELGIDVLFTCVPEGEIEKVYPDAALPGLVKVNTLTGFVPESLLKKKVPPIATRRTHVGYRARKVPYWLGALGVEKWRIAPQFRDAVAGSGLRLDISYEEADRIYGRGWLKFVKSCKCTLGVESGASVFDFTGEIQRAVDEYVARKPDATFEEVQEAILAPHEGRIILNQISPRCFEAAALRTAMILFEGEYSGVLEPWRHYIPLKKDFSNIAEVVAAVRDDARLQELVDRTYKEIACNSLYSYNHFINEFDGIIESQFESRARIASGAGNVASLPNLCIQLLARPPIAAIFPDLSHRVSSVGIAWRRVRFRILNVVLAALYRIWAMVPTDLRNRARPLVRRIFLRN